MTANNICKLPESLPEDLAQLKSLSELFAQQKIEASRFQAFRVPQGVYEQRESGCYMIRARLVAGLLAPEQMRAAARAAGQWGDGALHLTTRQDLQIHAVSIEHMHDAVAALAQAGLSSKGGGGNTVRNIAACPLAGVCCDEVFDVTPHVAALTERLLDDPLSYQLPRKYKIAFSGCSRDCAAATVNDLGLISKRKDDIDGFSVYVAGGMGSRSAVGRLLEDWIPADQVARVAEAVKRVFDRNGDRKNRNNARLRFLVRDIGFEKFQDLYRAEYDSLGDVKSVLDSHNYPDIALEYRIRENAPEPLESFQEWRNCFVVDQKQSGHCVVEIAPPHGLFTADQLARLADVVERFGDGFLRATNRQSFLLRWVAVGDLCDLHAALSEPHLNLGDVPVLHDVVTCAGAATCRLGICLSRGLASALVDEAKKAQLVLSPEIARTSIRISGCPNSCGRHPIAQIGLIGAARRIGDRVAPHYVVQFGGHVEEGKTVLAEGDLSLPAANVPRYLVALLQAVQDGGYADFDDFLANEGRQVAREIGRRYASLPAFEEDPSGYTDWGASTPFSLAGRGPAECGAGVFDLIALDFAAARDSLKRGKLLAAAVAASRALLVTRGEQADTDIQALELFQKLFIAPGYIPGRFKSAVAIALAASAAPGGDATFVVPRGDVSDLLDAVVALYESMGPSLRLPEPGPR